jgi:methyl-accepting chemotaxis protein
MKKIDFLSTVLILKLFVGFTVSSTFLLVVSGDIESGVSWLITLLASFVITAVHYGLLRPKKKPAPGNRKGPNTFETYNRNAAGISKLTSKLSIGSAEVSAFVDKLTQSIKQDQEHLTRISDSCGQLSNLTDQANHQVRETTESTRSALNHSDQGRLAMNEGTKVLSTLRDEVSQAAEELKTLQGIASKIQGVSDVINRVARQTQYLSINATIEAARAGEAGRSFAVVADEVGNLSKQTSSATGDIESMLQETQGQIQGTVAVIESVVERTGQMTDTMTNVGDSFSNIASAVGESSGAMETIRGFLEGQTESVGQISESIDHVLNSMKDTSTSGQSVAVKALDVSHSAEQIFEFLADFTIDSLDRVVLEKAKNGVEKIQTLFEKSIQAGKITQAKLFSNNYRPIPNTNPQKYHSDFDEFTDQKLPKIQEPILASHEDILYVVAQDVNSYLPTYNDALCQPLTGDYETDLANNRTKKIYDDRVGKRASQNINPFLLQTYKRDIGDALHDLSVPIYVKEQHWGCLRVGFKAKTHES